VINIALTPEFALDGDVGDRGLAGCQLGIWLDGQLEVLDGQLEVMELSVGGTLAGDAPNELAERVRVRLAHVRTAGKAPQVIHDILLELGPTRG
jgi:hypothetical protein